MNKNEAIRSILKELEYGSLSAAETELRLNRLIDRELSRPLETPVNTTLIDLCSALILRLHGAEPMTKSADTMTAAVLKRLEREGKKASHRHWLRPIAAAAVLALIAAGSLGLIHFHWFTSHSTQNQEVYVIEGHEITTGKTAEADLAEDKRDVRPMASSSLDHLITYLGFDPHLPENIGGTWLPVKYDADMNPQYVEAACAYAPEGNLFSSDKIRCSVSIYSDPSLIPEVESLGEGGFVRMANTQVYRYISPVPGHIAWSWQRGNALLTLDAPLTAGLPESDAEALVHSQADVTLDAPPYYTEAYHMPEPLKRQPRMNRRRLRKFFQRLQGAERHVNATSLELENLFGFSFGNLDVLPEEWQFEEAVSLFNEERIKVTITYSGIADPAREFKLNIDVTADPDTPSSNRQPDGATVEMMSGVEVRVSSNDKHCEFSWSGQQTVYRVTSLQPAEEIAPTVHALVTGTMSETAAIPATPEPTPDTSFEDAYDDLDDEDIPAEDEVFLITEEDVRRTMAEQAASGRPRPRVTPEQVKAALERLGDDRSMRSEDLTALSEHLGFSLDYLSLEAFGWKISYGSAVSFNGAIILGFIYDRINEPQTHMTLHIQFNSDISEFYVSLEQNREGIWKNINGIRVYTYANCDRNACYWTEGMNSYMISSDQSATGLQQIVDLLTRTTPLTEAPDEMQVHHITSEDLRQDTERRAAAGLPDGRSMTCELVQSLIEQHTSIESSDDLASAAMKLGCPLDHLFLEGIGWEVIFVRTDFQHDFIMFEVTYQSITDPYQYARLVIYSYADIAAAHASVEQDEEGTHRTVDGHDLYTYTNHGRSGCVWYDGSSIYLLTAEQPDYVTQMAEQLARQL